ncbi:hypothetical protein DEO72_LG4g647 [Vigna unguiculata]|uniref:Uncharacterized protein n=1 Tax=Vigna unguiculata TaxID=3917 RepID=A0A4D6LM82_VIGUN|nr:hypothetical protein DEO72_LG4g647 [Vigna unguiculata]
MVNSCVLLLDNDPLLRNGQVQVLLSDNDPLLRNGQVQVLLSDNDPFLGIRQVKILLSSRPFPWEWSSPDYDPLLANGQIQFFAMVIDFLHQGPLLWNGHWFSTLHRDPLHGTSHRFLYIKALCKAMFIDFLVALRPSARQWSSISYIKALSFGMVIDSQHCIETLYMGLVIDSFTSRPSPLEWSLILNIASRPSTWDWSSIPLHQGPLQSNGH